MTTQTTQTASAPASTATPPPAPTSIGATAAADAAAAGDRPRLAPVRAPLARRFLGGAVTAVTRSIAVLALLVLWETAPRLGLVDRVFLPPFSEVAVAWGELLADGQLLEDGRASLVRSLSGFGLAVVFAVPLGLLIGWYKPVADLLGPLVKIFHNTAALALLPVFVLLLGIGETSKVSIVLYACAWPILLNTISAVRTVDPTLLKLARSVNLPPHRLFQKVILPASVPVVFTGIRLAGAHAVLVLIAAEMVGAKAGLGFLINNSQFNFAIPQMYAGILTVSAIGVVFNTLLIWVERRFTSWRTA